MTGAQPKRLKGLTICRYRAGNSHFGAIVSVNDSRSAVADRLAKSLWLLLTITRTLKMPRMNCRLEYSLLSALRDGHFPTKCSSKDRSLNSNTAPRLSGCKYAFSHLQASLFLHFTSSPCHHGCRIKSSRPCGAGSRFTSISRLCSSNRVDTSATYQKSMRTSGTMCPTVFSTQSLVTSGPLQGINGGSTLVAFSRDTSLGKRSPRHLCHLLLMAARILSLETVLGSWTAQPANCLSLCATGCCKINESSSKTTDKFLKRSAKIFGDGRPRWLHVVEYSAKLPGSSAKEEVVNGCKKSVI